MIQRSSYSRREMLKAAGAGALVAALAACAPVPAARPAHPRPYSRKPWAAPRLSMQSMIRAIVGHRPYRPAGFMVRGERLGDKLLVHNYGHGGGGISLSWGSSALALQEVSGLTPAEAAVIGSGVMGLTSARLLQDAGWKVTIYTRDMARHTTSNIAAGQWSPFSVFDADRASPAFLAQFERAARIAHHAYTNLGGKDYGVSWTENYELSNAPFAPAAKDPDSLLSDLYPYAAVLEPGEHPFPAPYVRCFVTMQIEPAVLLRRLTQDFHVAGGRYVVRTFGSAAEVLSVPENVVFNCTGLGAAGLFGDQELIPVKGQLVFFPPDPDVDYMTFGGGAGLLYMMPRSDAIVLGGTYQRGDGSREVDADETRRIVTGHERLFSAFRAA